MEKRKLSEDTWGSPHRRPSFYKTAWLANLTDLRIPPDFKKHISIEETNRVTLRSPTGTWDAKLLQKKGELYFVDGWQDFVKHHSLGKAEFLVFTYNGDMSFEVEIFGSNGCLKKYPSVGTSHQESASSFTSSFPFFKHEMKDYNVGSKSTLLIPAAFAREHLHFSKQKMILRNSNGIDWTANIIVTGKNNNLLSVTGGWKAFSDDNSIKKGDVCIFELVEPNVFQVHSLPNL